jgi:hypothetical protein
MGYLDIFSVTESSTIKSYEANIASEWQALPIMLKLFQQQHNILATIATHIKAIKKVTSIEKGRS